MGQLQRRNSELVDLLSADFINCWIPIEQTVLKEAFAFVEFINVPQNFRALVLLGQARTDRVAEVDALVVRFNGDDGDNYNYTEASLYCTDTIATVCSRGTSQIRGGKCEGTSSLANTYAPFSWILPGYARPDRTKWLKSLQSGPMGNLDTDADMQIVLNRGLWSGLEPITSVMIFPEIGPNFVPRCIFELYGVL